LREESEQQRGHVFQRSRAQIPRKKVYVFGPSYFFCYGRLYCTDPYSPYSRTNPYNYVQSVQPYIFGTKIEASLGTNFEADFRFLFAISGLYKTVYTYDCWHGNRGTKEAVQQYEFGTKTEAEFIGTVLVLRYFPWLEICICCSFVLS
jgi:hypothetical protein